MVFKASTATFLALVVSVGCSHSRDKSAPPANDHRPAEEHVAFEDFLQSLQQADFELFTDERFDATVTSNGQTSALTRPNFWHAEKQIKIECLRETPGDKYEMFVVWRDIEALIAAAQRINPQLRKVCEEVVRASGMGENDVQRQAVNLIIRAHKRGLVITSDPPPFQMPAVDATRLQDVD